MQEPLKSLKQTAKIHYGVLNFEKRKYPRYSVDLPVEYSRVESPVGTAGRALDISESGLLIYFPEKMEIGQRLGIKLFLSMGSKLITIKIGGAMVSKKRAAWSGCGPGFSPLSY